MSTRASVCFSAVCLILIVQVSSAYEIKPCDGYNGTLHSVEVHNCPNKTAEYCEIKWFSEIVWDANYTVGLSYDTAWTGYIYSDSLTEHDLCYQEPDFCPGKAGAVQSHQFKITVDMILPTTGIVEPLRLTTHPQYLHHDFHDDPIVCAELPVKFVEES